MDVFQALHKFKIIPFLKKWNLLVYFLRIFDLVAITLALQLSYLIYYGHNRIFLSFNSSSQTEYMLMVFYFIVTPVWLLILYLIRITEIPRTKKYRILFFEFLLSTILTVIIIILIRYTFSFYNLNYRFIALFCVSGFLMLLTFRLIEYKIFRIYRSKGYNYKNLVLIADETAIPFINKLRSNREWGYRLISVFTESESLKSQFDSSVIILGTEYNKVLDDLMEVDLIDEVFYFKDKIIAAEIRDVIRSCEELGVTFNLRIGADKGILTNGIRTNFADERFLTFINVPHKDISIIAKRVMDIVVSLLAIIITFPFMVFVVIAIRLSSGGPAIFRQQRIGLRGRMFNMYKFRTMVTNAEDMQKDMEDLNEVDGPAFKIKDDPRATKFGKFLRSHGLDELPQLFNILKGEMSLIGPRPALRSETEQYERWQLRRLSVKPGLSCFWQIKQDRNKIRFDKWMEMDLAYIDNWSFRLDIIILFRTLKAVLKIKPR